MAEPRKPVNVNAQKRSLAMQKKAKEQNRLGKSNTRAGKGKGSTAARKLQNAEVKDGTIRIGKNGKSYNVYDAKTGTWKRGVVSTTKPKPAAKPAPKMNSKNTKFATDRMNPGILPHNKGYMYQGAEGNRQLKPRNK